MHVKSIVCGILCGLLLSSVVIAQQSGGGGGFTGGTLSTPITLPNGTVTSPSFNFAGSTNTGFIWNTVAGASQFVFQGTKLFELVGGTVQFGNNVALTYSSGNDPATSTIQNIGIDASDGTALYIGQGINQTPRIVLYSVSASSPSGNYERLEFLGGTGIISLSAQSGGSGSGSIDIALNPKGSGALKYGKALIALGGGATPTLGTIGGNGPATAAQNTWMQLKDSTGASFWIPVWK